MPWYPGDFARDTMHLSAEEDGAYRRLIDACWLRGGLLPASDERFAIITKLTPKRWRAIKATISEFFLVADDGWRHKRVTKELAKAAQITEQRRNAGQSSGVARRQRETNTRSTSVEQMNERLSIPSQPPSQKEEVAALSAREGLGIIRRFDDLAALTFGEPLRRAFPDSTDLVIADRWLAAGADRALCNAVFTALMGRMKAKGQGPPKSLKYFDQAVSNALETAKQPMPEGKANGRKPGRLSPTEGLYAGFALALDEHEQADDRGAGSDAAEPLLDRGYGPEVTPAPKRGLAG